MTNIETTSIEDQTTESDKPLDEFCELCLEKKYYSALARSLEQVQDTYGNYKHYKTRLNQVIEKQSDY